MKKYFLLGLSLLAFYGMEAQQTSQPCVVFTTEGNGNHAFWRIHSNYAGVYENISYALNQYAPYNGYDKGPIAISNNGEWFAFRSTRFDAASAANGEAITIAKYDMSVIETLFTTNGEYLYGEGKIALSGDGNTVYFVDAGANHARDIFKTTRVSSNSWSLPQNISLGSAYDYNTEPALSATDLVFNASNDPYIGEAIGRIDGAGTLSILLTMAEIGGCGLVNSGYLYGTDLYFEAETDAERIWVKNGAGILSPVSASMTNDNSPTVSNGKIFSLSLPNSTHQIKQMQVDGSSPLMLTSTNPEFNEVLDIGIGAGIYRPSNEIIVTGIEKSALNFALYPNPNTGSFEIQGLDPSQSYHFSLMSIEGKEVFATQFEKTEMRHKIQLDFLPVGIYIAQIEAENGVKTEQKMLVTH